MPLPDDISYEKGSMHFVNPLTAIALCESISKLKAKAAVQTGASG